jgi:hypothetical protein
MNQPTPSQALRAGEAREPWLRRALRAHGIEGENPKLTSVVRPSDALGFRVLRGLVGLVMLYDAWASLSWSHKTETAQFLGVGLTSPWVSLMVAGISFVKLAIAASLLSGRRMLAMGWVGVAYGLFVWLAVEHGGDFGRDATDPGLGLPYIILFLYIIGVERLDREPDISRNEILTLARVLFGLLWAYDAALKLQPYFLNHYLDYITTAQKAVAGTWRGAYDQAWIAASMAIGPKLVALMVAAVEAAISISLLSGRGLRILGPIGIGLSLVIWTTAESWGGPYSSGVASTMPMRLFGCAIIYALALLYVWALYNPLDLLARRRVAP